MAGGRLDHSKLPELPAQALLIEFWRVRRTDESLGGCFRTISGVSARWPKWR